MNGHDDFVLAALVEEGLATREAVEKARKTASESDRSPGEVLESCFEAARTRSTINWLRPSSGRTQASRVDWNLGAAMSLM